MKNKLIIAYILSVYSFCNAGDFTTDDSLKELLDFPSEFFFENNTGKTIQTTAEFYVNNLLLPVPDSDVSGTNDDLQNSNQTAVVADESVSISGKRKPTFCKKTKKITSRYENKQHICNDCGQSFARPYLFEKHKEKFHLTPENGTCCGEYFKTSLELRNHKVEQHSKIKEKNLEVQKCPNCPKVFRCSSDLKIHLIAHDLNPPRPFACSQCDKAFSLKKSLKEHQRGIHAGQERYKCFLCSKKYMASTAIRGHLKSHGYTPEQASAVSLEKLKSSDSSQVIKTKNTKNK